jgi:glutamyl-tRNA(Gln) amidotransferase subunit D
MYSKQIEAVLKKNKIAIGDRIRVARGKEVFEGILLPRIELGDENCLTIKLDSGYNVGINYGKNEKNVSIEKLLQKEVLGKVQKMHFAKKSGLPKISLISTGGTIASRVDYKMGGVKPTLEPEEILFTAPALAEIVEFKKISSPFKIFSENMSPREWQKIAVEAAKELNSDAKGVIVTHGTDTLHYTAAALSFMLKNLNKPIALVGAQRSPDRGSFDGTMNLMCAAHYCLGDIAEVAIVMHASPNDDYCNALRGTKVRKMHTSRRDAFKPINAPPLARVYPDGKVEVVDERHRKRTDGKVIADTAFEEKVALVKAYPGSDPSLVDYLVGKKYLGIVVEATALGHVPLATLDKKDSWLPSIKKAVDKGVLVAFATQCLYGSVNQFVYETARELYKLGVVYCKDLLPETAYVKLGWVLAHSRNVEEAKKMMLENIAGEYNERLTDEDFI